jgi:secreted trypsin-like serine protease
MHLSLNLHIIDTHTHSICGGALIRNDFVLTSVTCVSNAVDIILRFGMIDRLEGPVSAIFRITNRDHIILHGNYSESPVMNDLALLYLEGSETLLQDPYVDVIELPTAADATDNFVGLEGNATGFGLTDDSDPPFLSLLLRHVKLPIISRQQCEQTHGGTYLDDKFCTDGTFGSTCIGDTGAPFVVELNGRKVLAGIGSVDLTQCTVGWPAIFTSLLTHLDWIDDNTNDPPAVDTTPAPPPPSDRCNCVCRCYTCPAPTSGGDAKESFPSRWLEK